MQATPVTRVWRAQAQEARAVAGLLVEFRDWWGRAEPSDDSFLAAVERLVADPDTEFLLGSSGDDGVPSGVCQLRFRFGVWHAAEDCWLEDLFVRPASRRSGLGGALVEAALERARDRGCARIDLDVSERNRAALALYERFGFSTTFGEDSAKTLLMRLHL